MQAVVRVGGPIVGISLMPGASEADVETLRPAVVPSNVREGAAASSAERAWLEAVREAERRHCLDPRQLAYLFPRAIDLSPHHAHLAFGLSWSASGSEPVDYDLFGVAFDRAGNLVAALTGSRHHDDAAAAAAAAHRFLDGSVIHSGNATSAASSSSTTLPGVICERESLYVSLQRVPPTVHSIVVGSILVRGSLAANARLVCVPLAAINEQPQQASDAALADATALPRGMTRSELEAAYERAQLFHLPLDAHEVGDRNAYLACMLTRKADGHHPHWAVSPVREAFDASALSDLLPEIVELVRPQLPTHYDTSCHVDCRAGADAVLVAHAFDRFGYLLDTRRFASEAPIAFDPELKSLTADVFLSVDRGASASHEPVVGTFNGTEYVFGTARFQTLCRVTQKPLPAARAFPILTGRWKLATYAHSYTDVSSLEQLLPALRATFAPQVATSLTLGIERASHVVAADLTGTSDPYVVVHRFGAAGHPSSHTKLHKTATKASTLDPVWKNEVVSIPLGPTWSDQPIIHLALWDSDTIGADDALYVDGSALARVEAHVGSLACWRNGSFSGSCTIDLRSHAVPFAGGKPIADGRGELLVWLEVASEHATH